MPSREAPSVASPDEKRPQGHREHHRPGVPGDAHSQGFVQGYNAQVAVPGDHVIAAVNVN